MNHILAALQPLATPIGELHLDPSNARVHGDRNLDAIKASLTKFGQRKPIVVQRDGMIVRAGNGTLAAAKALGWDEIAAVIVDEDNMSATGFAIADNRTAELATWDEDTLGSLLSTLQDDADFDELLTGFDEKEILDILGAEPGQCDEDEIPPVPDDPVASPGDLWLLGDHRLLCGDSTSPDDVARLLDGAEPELLVTDPPYGVELDMQWRDRAGKNTLGAAEPSYMQRKDGHTNTSISGDTIADWSPAFELVPSLRVAYVWHASAHTLEVGFGLRRIGFDLRQMLIWRKPHFVLSRTHYHYQSEPAWYAVRHGKTSKWIGSRDQSNVWEAASPKMLMTGSDETKEDHPTQKPMLCMERPVQNHDFDLVYEPFGGSGTTVIACERQKRRCFAMELDPKYCDVIVARWERYTGKTAKLVKP